MPLTEFQSQTLRLLASRRSPQSLVAWGTVLNDRLDSPRYSKHVHVLHDVEASVSSNALADAACLKVAGYQVTWLLRQPAFQRAEVVQQENRLLLE
jgi:hypothetical protein